MWSLHPAHLDRAGLVAGWREALLAQAVLAERTRGYRHHPQLLRFRETPDPIAAIGAYLAGLLGEAEARGYRFDGRKILAMPASAAQSSDALQVRGAAQAAGAAGVRLPVTRGQLDYEWAHLGEKLARRSPDDAERWRRASPAPHPIFEVVPGELESWERP